MLANLNDLLLLNKNNNVQRLAVVAAHDEYVIEAVTKAICYHIKPILIGRTEEITKILTSKALDIHNYQIIDATSDEEAAAIGVSLITDNQADFLMKGLLDTKVLLKAVVNHDTGIREKSLLSHVMIASSPYYHKVILPTDCAMVISPSVDEKVELINNAVELAQTLGYNKPKVGIVSAVEKVNPKIVSTVDAFELVKRFNEGKISNCLLDGPFAIDNLISMESVKHKGIVSSVAGDADILVFPNLEAGNVFYKTLVFLGKAEVAGIIVGAKCPIILTSRADSSQAKLFSIILAAVYQNGKNSCN